jgi:hypothetical protein
VKLN